MAVALTVIGMPRPIFARKRVGDIVREARRLMGSEPISIQAARDLAFFPDVETGLRCVDRIYANLNANPRPALTTRQRMVLRSIDAAHLILRWRRWIGDRREIVGMKEAA